MKLLYSFCLLLIVGAACTNSACGCSPILNQAVVWGQVTMDTGGPAPGAVMTAQASPLGILCVQDSLYNWGHADSLGRFRLSVFGAGIADSGCIFVGARFPPQGANARDTVVGPLKLRFLADPPFDSMNVNIVIRH